MSRVKRNRKRRLRKRQVPLSPEARFQIYADYGMINIGLSGHGPRRPARMALHADSRPSC